MRLICCIVFFALSISSFGQTAPEENDFVFEANLPNEIRDFYDQEKIRTNYIIRKDLNPFYLRGDLDGDKKMDCALGITEKKSGKKGILIYHTGTKRHFILGAGKRFSNGGDNFDWMNAWSVTDEWRKAGAPSTSGETSHVEKLESASALIYWTRDGYKWDQQGD